MLSFLVSRRLCTCCFGCLAALIISRIALSNHLSLNSDMCSELSTPVIVLPILHLLHDSYLIISILTVTICVDCQGLFT